jgi:hypothetical protein
MIRRIIGRRRWHRLKLWLYDGDSVAARALFEVALVLGIYD